MKIVYILLAKRKHELNRLRLRLIIKLFFIFGPIWIMDIVVWALKYHSSLGKFTSSKLGIFFDTINALQVLSRINILLNFSFSYTISIFRVSLFLWLFGSTIIESAK